MIKRRWKLIVLLFAVVAFVALAVEWLQNRNDPQGGSNPWCEDYDAPSIPNGAGMVVSIHTTICTTLGTDVGTYVHIHSLNASPNRKSLAFRFSPAGVDVPNIKWIAPDIVRITIDHVSQVSKMRNMVNGVRVQYVIGKQDYPPTLEAAHTQQ